MTRVTVVWRRELGVLAVNWTDILDGEIVNAAWAVAGMVARPRVARRVAADMDTAAWADTERLVRETLAGIAADPNLPELTGDDAAELAVAVRTPEVQGALQALLAVRLTDAPELDATRAREALQLALGGPDEFAGSFFVPSPSTLPPAARYAATLSEYFDEKIAALVATLEGRIGFAGLAQVRNEAYNARIVALLGAIERQVAALADPARGTQAEAQFLDRYRRQAHQRHGFLTPPDFDRRRRVPVADIYVPTWISGQGDAGPMPYYEDPGWDALTVWDLADLLDRTVLLGDPGGGKTTAANVLTDHFAGGAGPRIAFLVTLREYAAKTPIEWSVAEHIEHNLRTLYQSPAPDGLVERLLLTGRGVVIFDGLDELLDTSRRRDVTDRVEQFCSAYPLTPLLVTSRVVGYDQARLDDSQFTCYRLDGFGEDQVAEYAGKWFGSQEGLTPAEAAAKALAFLTESAHAHDLRANPLLLSLMCILYRGAGSLPGDRAGLYARCAELLLRKWDEQRDLYRKLGSDHLVEPTLRYLAWWLFTRQTSWTAATEWELIAKAAEFLYERGYETREQATTAARDFVEFCRGRMWVFSDAGTTGDGEKLYGFTHRTFLEYFAAWHLAVTSESPEELARTLAPRITSAGWSAVAELAIGIKSNVSDRGADRVYATLLTAGQGAKNRDTLLRFLATSVPSARPAPATVRTLTRLLLDDALGRRTPFYKHWDPLDQLLESSLGYEQGVAEETAGRIAVLVNSDDALARTNALRFLLTLHFAARRYPAFWAEWAASQLQPYAAEIAAHAVRDQDFRILALDAHIITVNDVLAMPDGLASLLITAPALHDNGKDRRSFANCYVNTLWYALGDGGLTADSSTGLAAIGEYLLRNPTTPWLTIRLSAMKEPSGHMLQSIRIAGTPPELDEVRNLAVAALACMVDELRGSREGGPLDPAAVPQVSLFQQLSESGWGGITEPTHARVPADFRQLFAGWAARQVDFVARR